MAAIGLRILISAGEDSTASFARLILASLGHQVSLVGSMAALQTHIENNPVDIAILDLDFLGLSDSGILLERISRATPQSLLLAWCEEPQRLPAASASRLHSTLERSAVRERLIPAFSTLLERFRLRERLRDSLDRIVGASTQVKQLYRLIEKAAATNGSVLITGESGTGKELVARAIAAPHMKFVIMNCSAIPENLFESELFGHLRGSFTGAANDRIGLFEEASGGCLFLDEIGDMPSGMQTKLLRALQEGEIRPVGSNITRRVQVRIIAATNRDLAADIQVGKFREDLFYRLDVIPVRVPPLRERLEDLPKLVEHFLAMYGNPESLPSLSPDAWNALEGYHWPGNIRELENVIHRAVSLMDDNRITARDIQLPSSGDPRWSGLDYQLFREHLEGLERDFLASRLREFGGSVTRAAKAIGLGRTQFHNRASRLGLDLQGVRDNYKEKGQD